MRRESFDACYAMDLVLEEIERAVEITDESGYAGAVSEAQEACEKSTLMRRLGGVLMAATVELF